MRFDIQEADLTRLVPCALIAILARKRLGKTTFARWLTMVAVNSQRIPKVLVMCGNEDNMREWQAVVHPLFIMMADLNKLRKIREEQEKLIKADLMRFIEAGGDADDYEIPLSLRMWVVFDDTGYKRGFNTDELMDEFACNHRHLGMDIVFLLQYFNQIPPMVRDQMDYIGMFQTTNDGNIKKVYDTYVGTSIVPRRQIFSMLLGSATQGRGKMLWIDNAAIDSQTVEKRLYYLETPYPIEYKVVGDPAMLAQADLHHSSLRQKRLQRRQMSRQRTEAPYYETGYYSARQGAWVGGGGKAAFPPPAGYQAQGGADHRRWAEPPAQPGRLRVPRPMHGGGGDGGAESDYPSPRRHRDDAGYPPPVAYEDRLLEMKRREKADQEGLQRFASSKRSTYTDYRGRNVYIRRA